MLHRMVLLATLVLGSGAGCGEDPPKGFATYQECFDEYHDFGMGLGINESILECCLSHPIDDVMPACGGSAPDCINYLTANLNQTSASTTEKMDACGTYADQL